MNFIFKFLNKRYSIRLLIFFISVFLFLFFVGGAIPVMLEDYSEKNESYAHKYIGEMDRISEDIKTALTKLNGLDITNCDDEMIKQMRFAQFESKFIKDIGYSYGGKLLCTSGLGKLEKPFNELPPDLITPDGALVWLKVPIKLFNFEKMAHVVRVDHFNAVFNTSEIDQDDITASNIAIYVVQKNKPPYFYGGNKELTIDSFVRKKSIYDMHGMKTIRCSETSNICAAVYVSYSEIIQKEASMIFGIVMLSAISTIFFMKFLYDLLNRFKGFRNRFRFGINHERVLCYYQPIVEMQTSKLIGCEVLCRWVDFDGRVATPDEFLNIIKELHKTKEFTQIIIDKSFDELAPVISSIPGFKISFNIFPSDFQSETIVDMIGQYRVKHPELTINLELTEDELIELAQVSIAIDELRAWGYVISIDDFGTGYSSLSYLRDINADYIKIDRSFVREIEHGSIKSSLIPNIVNIANDIGAQVIAEGIENQKQIEFLMSYNVPYGQGYLFGRPCPVEEFSQLICGDKLC